MRNAKLPRTFVLACAVAAAVAACSSDDAAQAPPVTTPDAATDTATEEPAAEASVPDADAEVLPDGAADAIPDGDAQGCTPTGIDPAFADLLQQALSDGAGTAGVPGASAAVHVPCEGTWAGVAGESDLDAPAPMTPGAMLRIASITKTYTAALIHLLVGEGKLTLDDLLDSHVADVPGGDVITVRMLLNHTSGLFDYAEDTSYLVTAANKTHAFAPEDLVAYGTANPPYFEPGTGWHYSNTNYVLLGMIVEKLGGATIGNQFHTKLLAPQGLEHTLFAGEDTIPAGSLAEGYEEVTPGQFENRTETLHPSAAWAAGAMVADATDTALWGAALFDGSVLDQTSLAALEECVDTGEPGQQWGAGVACLSTPLGTLYGHGGGIPGYTSVMLYVPAKKTTVAVIANMTSANLDGIVEGLLTQVAMH